MQVLFLKFFYFLFCFYFNAILFRKKPAQKLLFKGRQSFGGIIFAACRASPSCFLFSCRLAVFLIINFSRRPGTVYACRQVYFFRSAL